MYFQLRCRFLSIFLCVVAKISCQTNETVRCRSECSPGEKSLAYLDVAMDAIYKAKENLPVSAHSPSWRPMDCADLMQAGHVTSGVQRVWPRSRVLEGKSLDVYCDMHTDGGGWTVIQRRGNYSRSQDYFFQDWASYKAGFGDLEKEFWLGNDNIFALSNQRLTSIRFDLVDVAGERRFALYDLFWVDGETNKYQLHIKEYRGDAGDSMKNHDAHRFSTHDKDNDKSDAQNCAEVYKGGWWYSACHHSNLNGLNLQGKHESFADGIEWHAWKGFKESLHATEMKVRPRKFQQRTVKEIGSKTTRDSRDKTTKDSRDKTTKDSRDKASKEIGKESPAKKHMEGETPRV